MAQCNKTTAADVQNQQVLTCSYIDHCIDNSPSAPPPPPPSGRDTSLEVVYNDHQIDMPTIYILPEQPSHFFRLSPEIRTMIYKLLMPPGKVVRARAVYDHQNHPKEWIFSTKNHLEQPLLSRLWREAREFILESGSFIFQKTSEDGGLWWNPEEDTLAFHLECWESLMPHALEGLQGLEEVCHIELDQWQARYMSHNVHHAIKGNNRKRQIHRVDLRFRTPPGVEEHFIPKYFSHVRTIRVWFDDSALESYGFVCLNLKQKDLALCMQQMEAYAKAWKAIYDENAHFFQEYELHFFLDHMHKDNDGRLVYYTKPGSRLNESEGEWSLMLFDEVARGEWDHLKFL